MPRFLTQGRSYLLGALILIALSQALLGVVMARQMGVFFADISSQKALSSVSIIVFFCLALALASAEWLRRFCAEALGLSYTNEIRLGLTEGLIQRGTVHWPARQQASEMLPFLGDLSALRSWIADGLVRGFTSLIILAVIVTYFFSQNLWLGLGELTLLSLSIGALALIASPLNTAIKAQRRRRGLMTAFIFDQVSKSATLVVMALTKRAINRVKKRVRSLNNKAMDTAKWIGLIRAIVSLSQNLTLFGGLLIGAYWADRSDTGANQIVGLLSLIGLMNMALSDLSRGFERFMGGRLASLRIRRLFQKLQAAKGTLPEDIRPHTGLRLAKIKLSTTSLPFSARLRSGAIVLLEDSESQSCERLMDCLAGLTSASSGVVSLKGRPVSALKPRRRRLSIGVASIRLPILEPNVPPQSAEADAMRLVLATKHSPYLLILDEIDRYFDDLQIRNLSNLIATWPGIVILKTQSQYLRQQARQSWGVSELGITMSPNVTDSLQARPCVLTLKPKLQELV